MDGLRAYAFTSIFVAHASDGELHDDELLMIRRNVHRAARALGHRTQAVEELLRETVDAYHRLLHERGGEATLAAFRDAVRALQAGFSGHPAVLAGIQADLAEVAGADGHVEDMERFLIDHVAQMWSAQAGPSR